MSSRFAFFFVQKRRLILPWSAFLSLGLLLSACVTRPVAGHSWEEPVELWLVGHVSLAKKKIALTCGEKIDDVKWRLDNSEFCKAFSLRLMALGADTIINRHDHLEDLQVLFLTGLTDSVGCGLNGFLTYVSGFIIPCNEYKWTDYELKISDRRGVLMTEKKLRRTTRSTYSWVSTLIFLVDGRPRQETQVADERFLKYLENQVYDQSYHQTIQAQQAAAGDLQ